MAGIGALAFAFALAGPALQAPVYGSINCVYDQLTVNQRAQLKLEEIDSDSNGRILEPAFNACGPKNKWPAQLYPAVVSHLFDHVSFDRAEAELVKAGGKKGDIQKAWAALPQADQARIATGDGVRDYELRRLAPDLARYGPPVSKGLFYLARMLDLEAGWARLGPDG